MITCKLKLKRMLFAFFMFAFSSVSIAQYQFNTSVSSSVTSISSGSMFTYLFNYSTVGNTTTGINVLAEMTLPDNLIPSNETNFNSNLNYVTSHISNVSYSSATKKVIITFVNPLPAGVTGQFEIQLKYINATTPNGYAPDLFTKVSFNNPGANSPIYSDTINVSATATNKFSVAKLRNAGGSINELTIFRINIANTAPTVGALRLVNPVLRDTLPVGVEFLEATAFTATSQPSSSAPTYDSTTRIITWVWPAGVFETNYSGSAFISVRYLQPTFQTGNNVCNSATLNGLVSVLPLGAQGSSSRTGAICFPIQIENPSIRCDGGAITAATANWLSRHVLAGTSGNSFVNGWTNNGNVKIDSVNLSLLIDKSIDFTSLAIGRLLDGFGRTGRDTIQVWYKTNVNSNYTLRGTYFSPTSPSTTVTISLPAGQYVTELNFKVYGNLQIGSTQTFTYTGAIRTSAMGAKDGSPIIAGTTYLTSNVGDDGTLISNNSFGSYTFNSVTSNFTNCSGSAEIMVPRAVFSTPTKTITNGSSFRASDTISYRFSIQVGGNLNAQNVVLLDTLDSRLRYVPGSSSIVIGSNTITPIVNGQILSWNLGNIPANGATYAFNFRAVITPGTSPGSILNRMHMSGDAPAIFPRGISGSVSTTVISAVALIAYKGQKACDSDYVYFPLNSNAKEGGLLTYKISVRNEGNVAARDLTLIDVFPFIGDSRGSEWFANLVAPVTLNDINSTVFYNTVVNPCYSDFFPAVNPTGCSAPVWTTTPPSDISSVTAIKIVRSSNLPALDSIVFTWPMRVPVGTPSNKVMNNTVYYQVSRADVLGSSGRLLPAAPNQIGMFTNCSSALGSIGNFVWIDSNKNGLQDEPVNYGLNGVKVYLYSAGLDSMIGGGDDVLLDSTVTGNNFSGEPGYYKFIELRSGKYYVKFEPNYLQYTYTNIINQAPQLNGNNDVNANGISGLITINELGTDTDKDNASIDAGYFNGGSIGNYVWRDLNGNGLQDEPASEGMNDEKIYLFQNIGSNFTLIDSTVTTNDASGNPGYYNFLIDSSGEYRILFPQRGLTSQSVAAGTDGNSDANVTTGLSPTIVLNLLGTGISRHNPTIDAGYSCTPTSSTDTVYICAGSSYLFNGNTYNAAGVYSAVLMNAAGCDSTVSLILNLVPIPQATFNINDANQCLNNNMYAVHIQNPQSAVKYIALYGDGESDTSFLSSFSHTYTQEGNFTITVFSIDTLAACQSSANALITILPKPLPRLWQNDTARCIGGNLFAFQNYSSISVGSIGSVTWYFGDGSDTTVIGNSPVMYRYNAAGRYKVVAEIGSSNNCVAYDTLQVHVQAGPVASFELNQTGCSGNISVHNLSSNANSYEWTFASTNSSYVFTCSYTTQTFNLTLNPGDYTVSLVAKGTGDCADTMSVLFTVLPKPNAVFSFTANQCATSVQFNNYSFGASEYVWNFGDQNAGLLNTSMLKNPDHVYSNAGTYKVQLIVRNESGCTDTMERYVQINPSLGVNPVASFSYILVVDSCSQKVRFTSTSSHSTSLIWLFHDGTMASGNQVSKSFLDAGDYVVKLVAISSSNCVDTITQTISIGQSSNGISASFLSDIPVQCLHGNTFNFSNTSNFKGNGWINRYRWTFGDGSIDTTNSFVYNKKYTNSGVYAVQLIAMGSNGCHDTAYHVIEIKESPTANFSTGSTCGTAIHFTNTSSNSIGNYWNMGDGGALFYDSIEFTYTYTAVNWYLVTMINVAENGCTDTLRRGISVNNNLEPVPSFNYSVDACSQAIQFHNTSLNGGSYVWNFGDNSKLDSSTAPIHGFAMAGVYSVSLTAYQGVGCSQTISQNITAPQWLGVYPPSATFNYQVIPCSNTIIAIGNSQNVSLQKWLWDGELIGWGDSIVVDSPSIGGHSLAFVVSNGACYDTLSQYFHIQGAPIADFNLNNNTCSNTILVNNLSKNANTFHWNFGDLNTLSDTAKGVTAAYTYPLNGLYQVRLIARDLYGCADTNIQQVTVSRAFNASVANFSFDNSLCECKCQNIVKFNNLTRGSNNTYLWTFGDGTSSIRTNPSKGFPEAGTYQITLVSIDSVGCMSSQTKPIQIHAGLSGPSASFNTDYQVQCLDNNNFNFYNTSKYMGQGWINKYYWYFGDGTMDSSNTFIFNKKYTNAGNYIVTLVAVGAEGCRDTMSMYVQVRSLPCSGALKYVNLQDGSNWNVDPKLGGGEISNSIPIVEEAIQYSLFPNPNMGNFWIQFKELMREPITITVLDVLGKQVYHKIHSEVGMNLFPLEIDNLSDGTYMLFITSESRQYKEQKFIVIH